MNLTGKLSQHRAESNLSSCAPLTVWARPLRRRDRRLELDRRDRTSTRSASQPVIWRAASVLLLGRSLNRPSWPLGAPALWWSPQRHEGPTAMTIDVPKSALLITPAPCRQQDTLQFEYDRLVSFSRPPDV